MGVEKCQSQSERAKFEARKVRLYRRTRTTRKDVRRDRWGEESQALWLGGKRR